jgi:small ligand-binding sensory domain FIST
MTGFRTALAIGPWQAAVESCLATLGPPSGGGLGFLYATDHLAGALPSILAALAKGTGTADWVGTVGLGVAGQDASGAPVEPFDQPALAVMLADLPRDSYRLIDRIEGSAAAFAAAAGAWLAAQQPTLGLVHGDPRNPRSPAIVADLAGATGAYLVGGLTASRAGLPQLAGALTEGGVSGVLFAQGVGVATGLSQGCTPIGPARTVTEAERTIVKAIDGRPAVEALRQDLGDAPTREPVLIALPVAGSDTADYLVRNLGGIDPARGWLAVGAEVAAGQSIRFVRRNRAAAVADLERMLDRLARQAGDNAAIKGGIYVSCVARGPHLFGPDAAELKLIRAKLGNFPLVGFFANGEICRGRLYTHTGVLTLFL